MEVTATARSRSEREGIGEGKMPPSESDVEGGTAEPSSAAPTPVLDASAAGSSPVIVLNTVACEFLDSSPNVLTDLVVIECARVITCVPAPRHSLLGLRV